MHMIRFELLREFGSKWQSHTDGFSAIAANYRGILQFYAVHEFRRTVSDLVGLCRSSSDYVGLHHTYTETSTRPLNESDFIVRS